MKKIILIITILFLIVIIPSLANARTIEDMELYETDQVRKAKIKLTASNHVEDFGVTCKPTYGGGFANEIAGIGACVGTAVNYSASTFEVDLGNESGAKYWGYCMDPGYAFGGGSQTATCTRRYDSNLKYLADAAGSSHKNGGKEGKVYELALRLLGIENGYSSSAADKEVGRGLNQVMTFLEQSKDAYDQAIQACGFKNREQFDSLVDDFGYDPGIMDCVSSHNKEILKDNGLDGMTIKDFISGSASDIFTDAYWLLRDIKKGKYTTGAGSSDKPAFELDVNNVTCSGTSLRIPITSRTVAQGDVKWQILGNVFTGLTGSLHGLNDFGDHLLININKDSEFNCDENGASFGIRASYKGGTDGDMYVCSPDSGNQQSILVYTGAGSVVPGSANDDEVESNNSWVIPLPSCARDLLESCTGCSHDPVEVKTQGGTPNCCAESGAGGTVQDQANGKFDINEIFGKNEELNLEHQKVKCQAISATKAPDFNASNAESDTKTMQKYCTMYCMETSSAHVPGPVEVTSGRYFTLPISTEMSVSERRDCRIQIKFDNFLEDYMKVIQREIDSYNKFQVNGASYAWFKEVTETYIDNASKTHRTIKYKCTRPKLTCKTCLIGTLLCDKDVYDSDTKYVYTDLEYYYIDYKKVSTMKYPYQLVDIKSDYGKGKANSKIEIVPMFNSVSYPPKSGPHSPTGKNYWTFKVDEDDDAVSDLERYGDLECDDSYDNAGASVSYSCVPQDSEYNTIWSSQYSSIESDRDDYKGIMERSANSTIVYANEAKKLEESMYECEHYFTEGDGAKVGNHYKINIKAGMSYDLVYNKDNGEVTAMTQNGKIVSNCGMGVGEADSRAYADLWGGSGKKEITLKDFSNIAELDYLTNKAQFKLYLDDERIIDKSFKVSGTYSGGCSFNDQANTYNTLFAGGLASPVLTPSENYTSHSKVYHAPLTNYTGRMEIRYSMGGFGSQVMRNFDSQFSSGSTCSGLSKSGTGTTFSCYYDSKQKLVTTGRCRDGKVVSTGNYMYNCGPYCEGNDCDKIHNFNFKTVDPSLLFPNGTQNGTYAKNWVLTKEGKQVQAEIQSDDTFNPSNLTYSFSFTSGDLNLIKKYNESRIGSGGYSDFKLTCKCGNNSSGQTIGTEVCHECISEFLTNLYDKKINYNGGSRNLTMDKVWGNDKLTLNQVRYNGINHWSRDTTVENPR